MKLASFRHSGISSWGVIDHDYIHDLGQQLDDINQGLKAWLARSKLSQLAERLGTASRYALTDVELLPVIPNPGKIICIGHNYETHRQETNRAKTAHPSVFTRFADTLVAHRQPLLLPSASTMFDFEGELAVIIGSHARSIPEEHAADCIAGYTCFNDASVRDWQWHTTQFGPGKNFPGTGGCGPWLVTADEILDIRSRRIVTRLNGEVVQEAMIDQMIFPIETIVAYVSEFTPLAPGDIICTGTPGGVGAKRTPPLWMKAGDSVEVDIEGVGSLINDVQAA